MSYIIGTVFKEMKAKPSILKDLTAALGQRRPINYCRGEDTAVLED